eukprot:m.130544 g.130544  ORF g.130544 m.130544 type:complete len:168 (+) comp38032_c0_seq8:121-624(+)
MASSCTKRGADVETTPENLSLAKRKKEFSRLDDTKDYDDISDDIRKSSRDSMPLRVRTSEKALRSVVKIFVQSTTPNCSMPWQMKRQRATYGSGFVVSGRRLLTNAHVVAYQTSVNLCVPCMACVCFGFYTGISIVRLAVLYPLLFACVWVDLNIDETTVGVLAKQF